MLRNTIVVCWTKDDVDKSLKHAKESGERTVILGTESSQLETKLNVVQWVKDRGHQATLLDNGSVEVIVSL
jgi:hypothetical protein